MLKHQCHAAGFGYAHHFLCEISPHHRRDMMHDANCIGELKAIIFKGKFRAIINKIINIGLVLAGNVDRFLGDINARYFIKTRVYQVMIFSDAAANI